jgi:hypothetical protein
VTTVDVCCRRSLLLVPCETAASVHLALQVAVVQVAAVAAVQAAVAVLVPV